MTALAASAPDTVSTLTLGFGLKLHLDVATTLSWIERVVELARAVPAVCDGRITCWVAPTFPVLPLVISRTAGSPVAVGAQDLHVHDRGAFTGEVSGADLAAIGCRYVEVGHPERRRLFGETDEVVAAKVAAALRNRLIPVLCVGEPEPGDTAVAIRHCLGQLDRALQDRPAGPERLVVAYEPHWAIGADRPAPVPHVRAVCAALHDRLAAHAELAGSQVIYGGSAGPGVLSELAGPVDGLFLGRFAHRPAAVAAVLDEARKIVDAPCG